MFRPIFNISIKLLNNIKKTAEIVTELNFKRFPNVILLNLEKNAREISSYASTSIEGNPLPLTDVKKILKNRPQNARNSEIEVMNYNEVLCELTDLMKLEKNTDHVKNMHPPEFTFDLPLILKIHKGITKKLVPAYQCGHFRLEPVVVNDPKLRKVVYLPPDHKDVKSLMIDLIDFVRLNRQQIDPLILAGIFHKQFVVIHPFMDGNGRTARLTTKVLLASMGLNTFNLFSFENYYNQNVSRYFEFVGLKGDFYDLKDKIDFTEWLEYFTDGILDELLRVKKILENAVLEPKTELKPYHKKMLDYINTHGYITDQQYAKLVKRAKATRNLDFNKLIELGIIKRLGKGKNTYYKKI